MRFLEFFKNLFILFFAFSGVFIYLCITISVVMLTYFHQFRETILPSAPADSDLFSQCPQTLTAAVAEVWVGAHYFLVEPRQKRRKGFFKGSKLRFSLLGFFILYVQIQLHAWCDLFHVSCVCHQQSALVLCHPGNNFRSLHLMNFPPYCNKSRISICTFLS